VATPCSLGSACGRHLASSKTATSISTRYSFSKLHVLCCLSLFLLFWTRDTGWLDLLRHALLTLHCSRRNPPKGYQAYTSSL